MRCEGAEQNANPSSRLMLLSSSVIVSIDITIERMGMRVEEEG